MESRSNSRIISYFPLILSIAVAIGFFIGANYTSVSISEKDRDSIVKYNSILRYVEENYVDEVSRNKLIEKSISTMLHDLDPHSVYIPSRNTQAFNETLQGHFGGVGVRFRIYHDTLMVTDVIPGGPAERSGVKAHDRIIEVDDENIAGVGIANEDVMSKLKGRQGTIVKVKVLRSGKTKEITIVRGIIPLKSVEATYMLSDDVGYLHLTKFSATTSREFVRAISKLRTQGMQKMVIDLRGNSGGYLDQAVELADQILGNNALIVYTKGRNRPREEYIAQRPGLLENNDIVILINEGSASASEILAGAVQDNDRGLIVGRRSFGKGLVQERKILKDKSELRLTIARYYTPAGRSIQRPYGGNIDYQEEHYDRYENGELYKVDSSLFVDSLKYHTVNNGRVVYGGGGIMPDYFVPFDSSGNNYMTRTLRYLYDEFVYFFLDSARKELLEAYPSYESFSDQFEVTQEVIDELKALALDKDYVVVPGQIEEGSRRVKQEIKETMANHLYGFEGASYIRNKDDDTVKKALSLFEDYPI